MTRRLFTAGMLAAALLGAVPHPASAAGAEVEELAAGLAHPWALVFLPGGERMLVTERPGRLRIWSASGGLSEPLSGLPEVYASGQGGLLDAALSPGFADDRLVYLSYAEAGANGKSGTAVGRGRLSQDERALEGFEVIFRQQPKLSTGHHYGSRLVFAPLDASQGEGSQAAPSAQGRASSHVLFVSLGENNQRPTAQDLDKLQGKIVRLMPDGTAPAGNPFAGRPDARPEIWSYGHRNPQGMALNPWTGALWMHEHGPRGGDEINLPRPGANYGWPLATHGINYSGLTIPEARGATYPGTEPPHHYWQKSPALSGMAFYDHDRFPAWRHSLFIGALADRALIRLSLEGDAIVAEERLLVPLKARIRDVRVGPDGYVYLLTDESDGKLLRISPSGSGTLTRHRLSHDAPARLSAARPARHPAPQPNPSLLDAS